MHRIDSAGATEDNLFTEGNPSTGTPATRVDADILNALQEEIANAVEGGSVTLEKGTNNQLATVLDGIRSLVTGFLSLMGGTLTGALSIIVGGNQLLLRHTTNDTSSRNAFVLQRGNGAGDSAVMNTVGGGLNNVTEVGLVIGGVTPWTARVAGTVGVGADGAASGDAVRKGQMETAIAAAIPAGSVFHFAKNTAPTGYLECNGAAVSRTTYATLFAVVGTVFGAGNGTTTFNLPDLRGEFIRGWDNSRGIDSGRAFGSAQDDALQGHWHKTYTGGNNGGTRLGAVTDADNQSRIDAGSIGGEFFTTAADLATNGTNGTPRIASETRGRNVALMPCIRY